MSNDKQFISSSRHFKNNHNHENRGPSIVGKCAVDEAYSKFQKKSISRERERERERESRDFEITLTTQKNSAHF